MTDLPLVRRSGYLVARQTCVLALHPRSPSIRDGTCGCAGDVAQLVTRQGSSRRRRPSTALSGLVRAWHAARSADRPEIFPPIRDPLLREFRHAMLAGLSHVPPHPGPKHTTAQHPGRDLLEFCRDRRVT